MAGLTEAVASFVVDTTLEDIPEAVLEKAKKTIADTIGVILAGSRSEVAQPLLKYVAAAGPGSIPILGTGLTAAPEVAAMATGALGHALDFDDESLDVPGHPSTVVLSPLLASIGTTRVSGNKLLLAYVVGMDVASKLGVALGIGHYFRGWHSTPVLGIYGAVASAACLKALDVSTVRSALGIATSMVSGMRRAFGTMTKPLHSGWAARSGLAAVELAAAGYEGAPDALEAENGFFHVFGDGKSSPERLVRELGAPWALVNGRHSLKKYPCCYVLHRPIEGMLELRKLDALAPDDVESVLYLAAPGGFVPIPYTRPETGLQGKFSVEYGLAATLLDGEINLASFTDEAVKRPQILELLPRISKEEDPRCASEDPLAESRSAGSRGFIEVRVTTRDGRSMTKRVDRVAGATGGELTWADVKEKFRDCVRHAGTDSQRAEKALGILVDLDRSPDISELVDLLR